MTTNASTKDFRHECDTWSSDIECFSWNRREIMAEVMTEMTDDWHVCYNDCDRSIDNKTGKTYILTIDGLVETPDVKFGDYDEYEEGKKCSRCEQAN